MKFFCILFKDYPNHALSLGSIGSSDDSSDRPSLPPIAANQQPTRIGHPNPLHPSRSRCTDRAVNLLRARSIMEPAQSHSSPAIRSQFMAQKQHKSGWIRQGGWRASRSDLWQWGKAARQRLIQWQRLSPERSTQLNHMLWEDARIDRPYLTQVLAACLIASFGLLANSVAVIIGAMIIAPLMLPIRAIAWSVVAGDWSLFRRGFGSLSCGVFLAIGLSALVGWLAGIPAFGSEVLARGNPNLLDLGVALVAGAVSAYAMVQPKVSGTVAGTAIAVALMPPACTVGLAISQGYGLLAQGAALLLLTNLCGIALAAALTFWILGELPLKTGRHGMTAIVGMTLLLAVPLTYSFSELVRQARLEASLRQALLDRTLTFRRVKLIDSSVNWLASPPEVRLTVQSAESISPFQAQLLEEFLEKDMGQPFRLVFLVSKVSEIHSDSRTEPEPPPPAAQ
ncbi:MAG: DUF389 domain-containing protein [Limnothrix sp.]|nr:DUF389 domain-containing protein [Limnothrix sp.]